MVAILVWNIHLYIFHRIACTMEDNTKYAVARQVISDILSQRDVSLSVNSGSGIAELKIETGLPFRIKDKWATIGDDDRQWHLHLNMDEVVEARFVKEPRSDGRQSYSIRFFDSIGHLSMRANFIKLYDDNGNLIMEKVAKFDEIHMKHGGKEILSLRGQ
jgi:putative heme iron utilization protein